MPAEPITDVRPSPLAGRWYPAQPEDLAALVDEFLQAAADTAISGEVVGLLAPHAGLFISGPVAAYAYTLLRGMQPEVVAVLCPSHHPFPGNLLSSAHAAYETPLGHVPVAADLLAALEKRLPLLRLRRDPEHAIEIELPFLQRVLPEGFTLLPLMLGDQSAGFCERLGLILADLLRGRAALLVASSDLSHFYPQESANRLDHYLLDRVTAFDPAAVLEAEAQGKGFACGRGAIAAVMHAARALGADTAGVLRYATSGDVLRDYARVVGYGAGVFYRRDN